MFGSLRAGTRKRASADCPTGTYTTFNGLDFSMHCSHNLPGNLIVDSASQGASVEDCMEQCSRLRPLCYSTSFHSEDGKCFFKSSGLSTDDLTSNATIHSAIAEANELSATALSNACPYSNDTVQSTDSGMQYLVMCNLDSVDTSSASFCPQENPMGKASASSASCPYWHADTLEECAQWCSTLHPLCKGVTFNPDMGDGFANCYPKNNLSTGLNNRGGNKTQHFALTILSDTGAACPSKQSYTSNTGAAFQLSCNQDRADNTMISYHDNNLNSCIDTCGTSSGCVGVVYNSNLDYGFNNCYLKNATGVPTTKGNSTFALLTSSATSTATPSRGSSKSNAWIAGAVIGGLAAVVLVVGAMLAFIRYRRRRQSRRRSSGADGSSGRGEMRLVQMGGRAARGHEVAPVVLEAENSQVFEIGDRIGKEPKEPTVLGDGDYASEALKAAAVVAPAELAGSEIRRGSLARTGGEGDEGRKDRRRGQWLSR